MKQFTVYLDTRTGRTQVTIEAEEFAGSSDVFEFKREGKVVAVFAREKTFGLVEEMPVSDEGPGYGPGA
ncbi:MAG: hypothetical protein R6X14_08120 [bacterium]